MTTMPAHVPLVETANYFQSKTAIGGASMVKKTKLNSRNQGYLIFVNFDLVFIIIA